MQICLPHSPSFNPALGFFTVPRLGRLHLRSSAAERKDEQSHVVLSGPTNTHLLYQRVTSSVDERKGTTCPVELEKGMGWAGWDTAWGAWESGFMAPCSRVSPSLLPSITFRPHRDFRESGSGEWLWDLGGDISRPGEGHTAHIGQNWAENTGKAFVPVFWGRTQVKGPQSPNPTPSCGSVNGGLI